MAYVMHDMELDDEDKRDLMIPCDAKPVLPEYPWGLRITLTGHEMDRLELDPKGAVIGGMVHGHFMARITSSSENKNSDGSVTCRVEMQIEQLCIESEDEENEESDEEIKPRRRMRSVYGKT